MECAMPESWHTEDKKLGDCKLQISFGYIIDSVLEKEKQERSRGPIRFDTKPSKEK